jgi:PAS domain S-box-containing protein
MNSHVNTKDRSLTDGFSLPITITLVSLILLIVVWFFANQWYQGQLIAEQKSRASAVLSLTANTLSAELNRRLALLDGLYAYVIAEPTEQDMKEHYEAFAEALSANTSGVRNIAAAPGGIMQYIYPHKGNEQVLGYDPLLDTRPEVRNDVLRAIQARSVVLSGPNELLQGGTGVIARMAVFQDEVYWGLVNIVLDLDPILDTANLNAPAGDVLYALRDESGYVFFGDPSTFFADPVISRIELTEGYWELAGVPSGGWASSIKKQLQVFQITGILIVGLLTGLVYVSNNHRIELERAVKERTHEITRINRKLELELEERKEMEAGLREREEQYRSIFESVSEGLFINTLDGELVDFNPAAAHIHGYSVEEFKSVQPHQFIHPDSIDQFANYIALAKEGKEFRGTAVDLCKDGTPLHVEVYGIPFMYRGKLHSLAILRDITDQVEAYQMLESRVAKRTNELATLLQVSQTLTSTLDLEPLLGLILDQLKSIVEYEGAAIIGVDREGNPETNGQVFQVRVYRGPIPISEQNKLHQLVQIAGGIETLSKRQPLIIEDFQAKVIDTESHDIRHVAALDQSVPYIRSMMSVPLMVKDNMTGILTLHHSTPGHFTEAHEALALAFANQAAIAIENASYYRQAHSLAALEEREKLARELHDSVSQALYGIALGARTVRTLLERNPENPKALQAPVDYILSLAETGLSEMRALIFELRPEALEVEGLVAALEKQADSLQARHQIEVQTSFCEEPALPIDSKEALYRICQEALQNIIKHAHADRVEVRLMVDDGQVVLEIQDNGIGFNPQGSFPGHLGLLSMNERALKIAGKLHVNSSPGEGTLIRAELPLRG